MNLFHHAILILVILEEFYCDSLLRGDDIFGTDDQRSSFRNSQTFTGITPKFGVKFLGYDILRLNGEVGLDRQAQDEFRTRETHSRIPPSQNSVIPQYSIQPGNANPIQSGNVYPIQPGNSYSMLPGNAYPIQSGNMYPILPGNAYPIQPGNMYPIFPGNAYPIQPGNGYPIQTSNGFPIQPGNGYPIQTSSGFPIQPGNAYLS